MDDQTDSSVPSEGDAQSHPVAPVPGVPETSGLPPNVAAALAIFFLLIGGIVFLVLEKKNALVRFYAMQSVVLGMVFVAVNMVLQIFMRIRFIGLLFTLASWLLTLGCMALIIVATIKAFSGVEWEIPYIGKQARKFLKMQTL